MSADLVTRLRFEGDASRYVQNDGADPAVCIEAADEIERLRSLVGRYVDHVGEVEGWDFLPITSGFGFTEQEAAELRGYADVAAKRNAEPPANIPDADRP